MTTAKKPNGSRARTATKILVLDDNDLALGALVETLSRAAYDVRGTDDPEHAIRLAVGWGPDVAILDVLLGRTTGTAIGKRMKELVPNIKILYVTGDHEKADAIGPGHCLMKPYEAQDLIASVKGLVGA